MYTIYAMFFNRHIENNNNKFLSYQIRYKFDFDKEKSQLIIYCEQDQEILEKILEGLNRFENIDLIEVVSYNIIKKGFELNIEFNDRLYEIWDNMNNQLQTNSIEEILEFTKFHDEFHYNLYNPRFDCDETCDIGHGYYMEASKETKKEIKKFLEKNNQ